MKTGNNGSDISLLAKLLFKIGLLDTLLITFMYVHESKLYFIESFELEFSDHLFEEHFVVAAV